MSQAGRDECQTFPVATLNNNDKRSKVAMANRTDTKARGAWVVVAEQTTASVGSEELVPVFPASLVLGGGAQRRLA